MTTFAFFSVFILLLWIKHTRLPPPIFPPAQRYLDADEGGEGEGAKTQVHGLAVHQPEPDIPTTEIERLDYLGIFSDEHGNI